MSTSSTGGTPRSSAAGMANMATPTPNHPIWVKAMRTDASFDPAVPKHRRARRSNVSPVSQPM